MEYKKLNKRLKIIYISGRKVMLQDLSKWIVWFKRPSSRVWRVKDTVFVFSKGERKIYPPLYIKHVKREEVLPAFFFGYHGRPYNGLKYIRRGDPIKHIMPGKPLIHIKPGFRLKIVHKKKDIEK